MPLFDDEQSFQVRHGRAFLFNNVVNITLGPKEDRLLTTYGSTGIWDALSTRLNAASGLLLGSRQYTSPESEQIVSGRF